jgi:hypothetical protein
MPSGWSTPCPACPSARLGAHAARQLPGRDARGGGCPGFAALGARRQARPGRYRRLCLGQSGQTLREARPAGGLLDDVVVRGAEPHGFGYVSATPRRDRTVHKEHSSASQRTVARRGSQDVQVPAVSSHYVRVLSQTPPVRRPVSGVNVWFHVCDDHARVSSVRWASACPGVQAQCGCPVSVRSRVRCVRTG